MSFQAMTWALKQRVGNATGKAILLILANYADDEGMCFPSQERIATECECSVRSVGDWLGKFAHMGIIRRTERRRPDGYRSSDGIALLLQNSPANAADEISPAGISPENHVDLTGSICRVTYQGTTRDILSGTRARAKLKAGKPKAKPKREGTPQEALEAVVDAERARQLVEHRKALRKPLTFSAAAKLAKKLAEHSDPNEAADAMMANGWQGFDSTWMDRSRSQRGGSAGRQGARGPPRKTGGEIMAESAEAMLAELSVAERHEWQDHEGPTIDVEATRSR